MASISKNSVALLAITGVVAAALLLVSFQYSSFTSAEILEIAADDVRSNARIQSHDLEQILVNKVESVTTNLRVISSASTVQEGDLERARSLFDSAQDSTAGLTDFYMWLDGNGRIVWLSNINQTTYETFAGTDLSYRSYFTETKDSMRTYYSSVIDSNDNILRMYIAEPIVKDGAFDGVVVSAIRIETLGTLLEEEMSPGFQSSIGMIGNDGTILYTRNQTYIGQDVFGDQFQAVIPSAIKDSFNDFLRRSLEGTPGIQDITFAGNTTTLAYEPIIIEGEQFGTLYITNQHQFASNVGSLVDQQRNFSMIASAAIASVAVGIGVLIVVWNRRLEEVVTNRTSELHAKTEELKKSYDALSSANEQLKVHDRLQKEFINIAAHELRTPTQAILGYAELLQMDPDGGEEMIRAIYRNSVRLQRLTSDILDVTRIESESLKLDKERFNLSDIIQGAIQDAKNQLANGQIKFVYQPRDVYIEADRVRIMQVISNLLDNAIKFTKEGTITVSAESRNGNAVVTVTDTGRGIDSEIMPRLFSKFATKSDKGTGLGLFISRSIIEAHGGRIWAGNNSDGKGATFAFSVPA